MLTNVKGAVLNLKDTYISIMAMTQKAVRSIVIALVIALIGLTWLQVMQLGTAHDLEEQSFRSSVQAALNDATELLETTEATMTAIMVAREFNDSTNVRLISHRNNSHQPPKNPDSSQPIVKWEADTMILMVPAPLRVKVGSLGSNGEPEKTILDTSLSAGTHRFQPDLTNADANHFFYRFTSDDSTGWEQTDIQEFSGKQLQLRLFEPEDVSYKYQVMTGDSVSRLTKGFNSPGDDQHRGFLLDVETGIGGVRTDSGRFDFVQEIVTRLSLGERQPVSERLELGQLDSVLSLSLSEAGISLAYEYGVRSNEADTLELISDSTHTAELLSSEFYSGLFTRDFGGSPADLVLFFPDRELFLWQQIWPLALSATFLMAVIVLCFVYTIRTIFDQRRNASLMVDFVNNMTHEFKTPISTVALACEAILREDVISDRTKVEKFGSMIQAENRRMRHQAEKILQMAALEEKDHKLKLQPVDVHAILSEALENISLRVEAHKGELSSTLGAEKYQVMADPIHMAGIINNLLDNAVKYSQSEPKIDLRTSVVGQRLIIKISDQGVGLKAEDKDRIFDKYYRVSQGDLHDVKGFGLGLSYVKLMMAAHNGTIELNSELGHGTTLRLSFPLIDSNEVGA